MLVQVEVYSASGVLWQRALWTDFRT